MAPAQAIATNLTSMAALTVPIITLVIGTLYQQRLIRLILIIMINTATLPSPYPLPHGNSSSRHQTLSSERERENALSAVTCGVCQSRERCCTHMRAHRRFVPPAGEGGSGGALGIAMGNRIGMLSQERRALSQSEHVS